MGKILVIVGCGLLAGCVTVEKTRERLASGNVEQIEQAKRDARRMALDRYLPEAERIAYGEMLTENDTLYEMLPFLHDNRSVQAAAIKKMSLRRKGWLQSLQRTMTPMIQSYGVVCRTMFSQLLSARCVRKLISTIFTQRVRYSE